MMHQQTQVTAKLFLSVGEFLFNVYYSYVPVCDWQPHQHKCPNHYNIMFEHRGSMNIEEITNAVLSTENKLCSIIQVVDG